MKLAVVSYSSEPRPSSLPREAIFFMILSSVVYIRNRSRVSRARFVCVCLTIFPPDAPHVGYKRFKMNVSERHND